MEQNLRRSGLGTDHVAALLQASELDHNSPQRSGVMTEDLPEETNRSVLITKSARWDVRRMWRNDYAYSKTTHITADMMLLR